MKAAKNSLSVVKRAVVPAIAVLIIAQFVGYAVFGANGVLSWGDYRHQKQDRMTQLALLKEQEAKLAHRSALLDPRKADPDYVDEMVRRDLGVVRPDEVIIELPR